MKETIEENFNKDMQECVYVGNKKIEIVIGKNRNSDLSKKEKVIQLKNNLVEGFKKFF